MAEFNLNTLTLDSVDTEHLLKAIGFTAIGEDDNLLAIYGNNGSSVYVYDGGVINTYWNIPKGKRDEFLMACINGNEDGKFPGVIQDRIYSISELLDWIILG